MTEHGSTPPSPKSIPEIIVDIIDMLAEYARAKISAVVEDSAAGPMRRASTMLFAGIIAASLFGIAALFLAVALFLGMLELMPAWAAVGLIGLTLVILGLVVVAIGRKAREDAPGKERSAD